MTPFVRHLALLLASLILAAIPAWFTAKSHGVLLAAILILAAALIHHLIHIARLQHWLDAPKLRTIPEGRGLWQNIYDTLQRREKSRKKRKQRITDALQRFSRAAETIPTGIIILDAHKRIDWMNRLAAEHLGIREADRGNILGNLLRHPDFHHLLQQPREHTHRAKLTLSSEHGSRTLHLILAPFDRNEQLLISEDTSAAEQLDAARTAFVANVSHELRTPLTVINGFLETLADHPALPDEKRLEFIALMQRESSRMLTLINDLLTLARLETPDRNTPAQPVNLSRLVHTLADEARTLSQQRHRITADIQDGQWIEGHENDLYSALGNLISNAVRYTPQGGDITICLTGDGTHTTFAVKDTGPGIAAEHIPHLTERFYRIDKGRSRDSGGTGLGLAISKHALAKHRTRLNIESRPRHGSTFSATFAAILPPQDNHITP